MSPCVVVVRKRPVMGRHLSAEHNAGYHVDRTAYMPDAQPSQEASPDFNDPFETSDKDRQRCMIPRT